MSIRDGIASYHKLFGLRGIFLVTMARLSGKPLETLVSVPGIKFPLHIRVRTTDVSLVEEIMLYSEYDWAFKADPEVIVDAGANIGLSSVFFANKYPNAKIIAIEPEASNFATLLKNVAHYSNVIPIQGALWGENRDIDLFNSGLGEWGFQTRENEVQNSDAQVGRVRGITVDRLMIEQGLSHIDVLKIDIEGSEVEVFKGSSNWIDGVSTIVVELHDRHRVGCSRAFYDATHGFIGEWHKGEITVVARDVGAVTSPPKIKPDIVASLPFPIQRV